MQTENERYLDYSPGENMRCSLREGKKIKWKECIEYGIFGIIIVFIVFYIVYRAYALSYSYDESFTFNAFVVSSYKSILTYPPFTHSNNHLLNSVLTRFFYIVFGSGELSLRMPNVLAGFLYIFSSVKLSRHLSHRILRCVFIIFVLLNPFLLDFFSLSRGYGLGLGLMLGSIAFLMSWIRSKSRVHELGCLLLAALSVFANYVMMNYFLSLLVVIFAIQVIFVRKEYPIGLKNVWRYVKASILTLSLTALTLILVLPKLLLLRANDDLYFGGETSFWSDTARSLVTATLYRLEISSAGVTAIQIGIGLLFLAVLLFWARRGIRKETFWESLPQLSLLAIFSLAIASTILQNELFGTRYLLERAGLFYIPLWALSMTFLVDQVYAISKVRIKYVLIASFTTCAALYSTNYLLNANFSHFFTWPNDAHSKEVVLKIIDLHGDSKDMTVLTVNFWNMPPFLFYKTTLGLNWLELQSDCTEGDFMYDRLCSIDKNRYESVSTFDDIEIQLYEKIDEKQ